ncbi:MAG: hypothetical protein AB1796_04435 [Bacillota bacterium]
MAGNPVHQVFRHAEALKDQHTVEYPDVGIYCFFRMDQPDCPEVISVNRGQHQVLSSAAVCTMAGFF